MSTRNKKVYVTRPYLPPIEEFMPYLEKIWESRQLTNIGPFHEELESKLEDFLGVNHVSLVVNGTIALMLALKALDIKGEVITTPFSFVATTHVLKWINIKPVFVDIEPEYFNIDPDKIRAAITRQTKAILPVHVYGNPCMNDQIEQISKEYNLKLIYDASHAFGVKFNNKSILNFGDISVVSFHATKAFNTFEGGAIISRTEKLKAKIDKLRNYGFVGESKIEGFGINGKMNEFQASLGILQLKFIDEQVAKRKKIVETYKNGLKEIDGILFIPARDGVLNNHSFLPILVDPLKYGNTRDFLYTKLKKNNIFARKYFYPLISDLSIYSKFPSAAKSNLPVSAKISQQVLCLPLYTDLEYEVIVEIIEIIKNNSKWN